MTTLTYSDLLGLRDDEVDDLLAAGRLRAEIEAREADARHALEREFTQALGKRGTVPHVLGGRLEQMDVVLWLREWLSTEAGSQCGVDIIVSPVAREHIVSMLAAEYARENAVELLRAGWSHD